MAAGTVIAASLSAQAAPIVSATLQEGTHGEVITNKFLAQYGFSVSAVNFTPTHPQKAIIFNTRLRNTADPDLEGYNTAEPNGKQWTRGNLKGRNDLGKILILAENDIDANNDGLIDSPDDEGNRPAGEITVTFRTPITQLAFNLIDIEGPSEFGNDSGYVLTIDGTQTSARGGGRETARIGFSRFITPGNPFFDSTVRFGDNSANNIKPIFASDLGMAHFHRVVFNLGGSGGIDHLRYAFIPEPTAATLLLAGSLLMRRRR
ncbi:MAG: hypothetical protein RMJ35_12685 [Phycisphaerales bacterium]|nr:hypothetical protein [Phycisphaerales bacterium]